MEVCLCLSGNNVLSFFVVQFLLLLLLWSKILIIMIIHFVIIIVCADQILLFSFSCSSGRRITSSGQRDLDQVAGRVVVVAPWVISKCFS